MEMRNVNPNMPVPVKIQNEKELESFASGNNDQPETMVISDTKRKSVLDVVFESVVPQISKTKKGAVPFYRLYRFATCMEIVAVFTSIIFGILTGLCIPIGTIMYGEFTTLLIDRVTQTGTSTETVLLWWFGGGKILTNATEEENRLALLDDSAAFAIGCSALTFVQFLTGVLCVDFLNYAALRQIDRIRKMFFESVLRQDMTWYDTNTGNSFASSITEDLDKMKNGMGEKVGIFMYLLSSFVSSIIISFVYGWKLTLVVISCAPIIILSSAIVAKVQSSLTEKELKSYGIAGAVADEVLGAIRTVVAFGGESKEIERYSNRLEPATAMAKKKGIYSGIGSGIMWFIMYATYALGFWYGVQLILEDRGTENPEYTPAVLIIIFFGVLAGAQNLGLTTPHLEAFAVARGSAASVFRILDRKPDIDSMSEDGIRPDHIKGEIEFKNIHFQYPARPDVKVLRGLNLKIKAGERVAFVGGSGCGKSTLIQLTQRMYDPARGAVLIDGNVIDDLNVRWLREHIGVVGQEPILFATTIYNNIALGKPGATQEEIEKSAMEANCHDFIKKLPLGYETVIGERGSQLSGGQKQRIAIARALIKKPTILLLDEATSALDFNSEAKVQKALDKASFNCTTLIVSHRLSTVRNVDRIIFIKDGVVAEMGNHEELMEKKQLYYGLVQADVPSETTTPARKKPNLKKQFSVQSQRSSIALSSDDEDESTDISEEDEDDVEEKDFQKISLWQIMKMNSPEWPYLLTGSLAAIVVGASFPAFAILFGETYGILSMDDKDYVTAEANKYSLSFIVVGVITGICGFFQCYLFNVAGVKLTTRVRVLSFGSMLKQEIGWFDEAKNSVGGLCARLSSDAAGIQGATGTWIGAIMQAISTFILGIVVSLFFTWKLTLVSLVAVPLVLGAVFLEGRIMSGSGVEEKKAMESATRIAVEAISNVRTVQSLGQEPHFIGKYLTQIEKVNDALKIKSRFRGSVFSFGQAAPFFGYALSLWYGGTLVANKELEYKSVVKVSEALIFGAWMMGQALAFAPNFNAAKISAGRIFALMNRVPKIVSAPEAATPADWKADGRITYNKIDFSYPTRPEIQILDELDLTVRAGTTVALVGGSGCGKSTCIQLIQRLYDPDSGIVAIDGKDLCRDISIPVLRSQLGIVSQEPTLFDKTIAENIAYGDNSRKVSQEEIIEAAKKSNIHTFISSLPLGYETGLGSRGTQLSGGQKQRIAIARALVRNPRVLLLDEATSALDNQSEKVVQAALDAACEGRTCIIIAHRLSTVRNADVICVLENGKVVEKGTHDELISSGGHYSKLYNMNK